MNPFSLRPYVKKAIWGEERWVLSGMPGRESVTDDGRTLSELLADMKDDLVGEPVYKRFGCSFPLLAKFIDARRDLSLQVHPDDALAAARHGSPGKTEMWYVVSADPGAKIAAGFARPLSGEEYERLSSGDATGLLQAVVRHNSCSGETFFLPAGTVHAIGGGNLIAEIQQPSDVTYRLCDYGRLDADGRPRELHVELAREAVDLSASCSPVRYDRSAGRASLASCEHFTVERIVADGEADVDFGEDSFVAALCVEGGAVVNGVEVGQGGALLVPAADRTLRIRGNAAFLAAYIKHCE